MARVPMPHIAKVSKPPAAPKFPASKTPKILAYKPPSLKVPKQKTYSAKAISAKLGRLYSFKASGNPDTVKYPGPVRRTKGVI